MFKHFQTPSAFNIWYLFQKIFLSGWQTCTDVFEQDSWTHANLGTYGRIPPVLFFYLFYCFSLLSKSSVTYFRSLFAASQCAFATVNPLGSHGNMPTPVHNVLPGLLIDCSLTPKTINRIWAWGSLCDKAEQKTQEWRHVVLIRRQSYHCRRRIHVVVNRRALNEHIIGYVNIISHASSSCSQFFGGSRRANAPPRPDSVLKSGISRWTGTSGISPDYLLTFKGW